MAKWVASDFEDTRKWKASDFEGKPVIPAYDSITKQRSLETKTPIDQRLKFGLDSSKDPHALVGENYIGMNIIPAYKEDSALAKVGKGVVNYGVGGGLSVLGNIFGSPQQTMMKTEKAAYNAATGQKQNFRDMSFGKDILGAKEDNLMTTAIGTALDPTTYIGGGILDDLTKAGQFGKGATLGTAENLAANAAAGQRATKGMAPAAQQATREYLNLERNALKKDSIKTPDIITAQPTGTLQQLALPAPAKQEPFTQVKFSTARTLKPPIKPEIDNELLDSVRKSLRMKPTKGEMQRKTAADMINLTRKTLNIGGTQQVGKGQASVKTTLIPKKQQTLFTENLIDRPFIATRNELPKQPLKPPELKPSTNIQPNIKMAQNGVQTVKQDGVLKGKLNKFYSATVDNTAATKRTSDQAGVMSNVARNAGGTIEHIIDKGLVNMAGQNIKGKAVREIFNMPKDQLKAFDEYMFNKLNPERIKQGKELLQHDSKTSARIVNELEKTYPHFKQKSEEVYELLNGMLDEWGVKSGLVDTDIRSIVGDMYKHYVPGYRELKGADAISTKSRGMGAAKIINRAVGGDDPLMTLSKSIPMLINKTIKAARKNEVYREILKAAQKGGNQYAKILDVTTGKVDGVMEQKFADSIRETVKADGIEGIANLADKALEADPKLGYMLTVMDKGKPVKLQISEDLFKSLQALNGKTDDDLQAALRIFKKGVTNPFKALITGYNPLFAVRNVARDIPTAYIQGTENNPLKFARNLGSAAKDMIKKSERFQEYKALGGEGGNYFNVEKGLQPKGILEKPLKAISAINNFTETLPRYGEYLGTLKREGTDYASKMKALNNAQEVTVNFGRYGDVTKAIDAIVPYFNPAAQGLDKTVRTFKNPAAWAKALGVITVPTAGIYALNQIVDKKGYDNLDNRTKDTYFVFPMGDGKFVKVPKTREAGVIFGALFERIARQVEGQPNSFKGFANTLKTNFLIQNPATDNIAAPVVGLKYNKDFANRNIVPQYMLNDKRSPYLQFDEQTTELAKSIGNQFNLSPKQIDYIVKSYGGIVASIMQPALTKGGNVLDKAIVRPFTADSTYSNEALNNYYSKLDKLKQTATDKNIKEGISSKVVTPEEKLSNLFQSTTRSVSDIRDGITQLGSTPEARSEQQKLLELVKKITEAKDIYQGSAAKAELARMAGQYRK